MLDPDYLEQAGERVASVYSQIEADMLDYLVGRMIAGDVSGQRAQTAINLLAQSAAGPLMEIIARREGEIDAAVKVEVSDALRRSDADDIARIKRGMGIELPKVTTRQIAATVAGAEAILERQNLLMAESARNAFLQQSLWAVTQVNTGAMTTERALHAAVRRLERDGISLITYRNASTGLQTVQNKVDVAVRRHIRTQIAQDGMRLTEQRMDQAGVDLVEVSSHSGARPSHAAWEGRVYSRNGDKTIGGVRYRDFKTACNWGDVADGIGGANCRHSYAAWFPGMERTYRPNPEHPSGKTNSEVYELTQKQRAGERAIRQTKRELSGAQKLYETTGSAESLGDVSRLKIKLRGQQEAVRKLVSDNPKVLQRSPRREWAGDMPKITVPKASGRKVDEFLRGAAASKALKAKGATKAAAKEALAEAMKERGGTLKDFSALPAGEQQGIFRSIIDRLDGTAKAKTGKHAEQGAITKNTAFGKQLGKHTDGVNDAIRNAPNKQAASAWSRYVGEYNIIDGDYRHGAYFSAREGGLFINLSFVGKEASSHMPYQTLFHETGHMLDWLHGGKSNFQYFSNTFENGAFGFTLRKEANEIIEARKALLKKEFDANKDNIVWLAENGYVHESYKQAFLDGKISGVEDLPRRVTFMPSTVYKKLADELNGLPEKTSAVQDIFQGATNEKFSGNFGHASGYFDSNPTALEKEAFAEMMEASMANEELLDVIRSYFPKSYEIFERMMEAIANA